LGVPLTTPPDGEGGANPGGSDPPARDQEQKTQLDAENVNE
jgi:hypothetical protein